MTAGHHQIWRVLLLSIAGLIWLALSLHPALSETLEAPASAWSDMGHAKVRLISATDSVGSDGVARLGLQFEMEDGWKVYWRSPGDAGYPPNLDWSSSDNLASTDLLWPTPERFSVLGLTTLGYKNAVVFPITAMVEQSGSGLKAVADVDYLTCNEVCIPVQTTVSLALPEGAASPSIFAHDIDQYRARVPQSPDTVGLGVDHVEFYKTDDNAGILRVLVGSEVAFGAPDLFVEGPKVLEFAPSQTVIDADGNTARFDVPVYGLKYFDGDLTSETVTLTIVDQGRAAEIATGVIAGTGTAPEPSTPISDHEVTETIALSTLALMLGFALLGGLILNAMPCVLPVLSIKLLSLVKHGGGDSRQVRLGFLASSAGVITSFMIIAIGLIFVKSTGAAIGWGIQFQQPLFLIFITIIVTGFAMNLFGSFEIRLPSAMANIGGDRGTSGLGGHFLSGMLATLLATPCSAPFLGTAVAFALARGSLEIIAIFFCLGLGLALPYLTVALWPKLATKMPKPGPWMVTLRKIMGVLLVATAVWLVWVLSGIIATPSLIGVIVLLVAFAIGLALLGRGTISKAIALGTASFTGIGMFVIAAMAPPSVTVETQKPAISNAAIAWQPFDQAKIPGLIGEGKLVFVDVTADWCITCQVNKTFVLNQGEVAAFLNSENVIAMQADWTKPDAEIANYLARFNRYGIPFNAIYGPNNPDGLALPELLTESLVVEAFEQVSNSSIAATAE